MDILTPNERLSIRNEVYPFSEATPVDGTEEMIDKVQIKTSEAQAAKSKDEVFEKIEELLQKEYVRGRDSGVLLRDIRKLKKQI